jgi:TolB protein
MKKMAYLTFFLVIAFYSFFILSKIKSSHEVLAYSTIQPSSWQIYLFDHGKSKQLTQGSALNYNPTFSPDGNWLIFTSERTGRGFLYALDLRSTTLIPKRLTKGESFEDMASFSPDGKFIYYMSTRDGTANIFRIPFDMEKQISQKNAVNLTNSNSSSNLHPSVSPDGKLIAFSSNRDSKPVLITNPQPPENYRATNIYIMKTDGSDVKKLTNNTDWTGSPAWSSDGKKIYFYAVKNDTSHIYQMNIDGSDVRRISPAKVFAISPTIMPNNRIAFATQKNNKWDIASTSIEGDDFRFETDSARDYWSPDYNNKTQRLVAYGQGSLDANLFYAEVPNAPNLTKPMGVGAFAVHQTRMQLDKIKLDVHAVRGYFPNYIPSINKIASVAEFSKVVLSNLNGSMMKTIYHSKNGFLIGLSATKNGQWLTAGIGTPFSSIHHPADIWRFNLDGKDAANLTKGSNSNNMFPRFTGDGKHIIFRSGRSGEKNLYIMNQDGTNVKRLTFNSEIDTMPDVSPQGDKIVFSSVRNGENYRIYMLELNPDGSPGKLTKLTNGPGADTHPTLSPDGKWLAFASERQGLKEETPLIPIFCPQPYGEVYLMRLSDKKIIPITDNKWEDSLPNWQRHS